MIEASIIKLVLGIAVTEVQNGGSGGGKVYCYNYSYTYSYNYKLFIVTTINYL